MQNWDDDFNEIMKRKIRQYKEKMTSSDTNPQTNVETASAPNMPLILTDLNFSEAIKKYKMLVVDFWAPWCGPCKMVSPIIDQLSKELSGKVVFGKINVDENPSVSSIFGIQSIPTMVIFRNGQAIDMTIGAMTRYQLISKISAHIENQENSRFSK